MDMWLNDRGLAYHGPGPSLQCHKIIIIIIIIKLGTVTRACNLSYSNAKVGRFQGCSQPLQLSRSLSGRERGYNKHLK